MCNVQPEFTRRQADAGPKSHIVNRKPSIVNPLSSKLDMIPKCHVHNSNSTNNLRCSAPVAHNLPFYSLRTMHP